MLRGKGLEISEYPEDGQITAPGFYYHKAAGEIEHWSRPAKWNIVMQDHASNSEGLIKDGFQGIRFTEDTDHLGTVLKNWADYIARMEGAS